MFHRVYGFYIWVQNYDYQIEIELWKELYKSEAPKL